MDSNMDLTPEGGGASRVTQSGSSRSRPAVVVGSNNMPEVRHTNKAEWDDDLVENFLDICIDLHLEGHKPGSHLNAVGYEKLEKRLYVLRGVQRTRLQLKNKFERLRTDRQIWKILSLQTGIGWNTNIDLGGSR